MIIKQTYRDAKGNIRSRKLEAWECRCDEPDWCGCGRCHRCGDWLRRTYDHEVCATTVSKKRRFRKILTPALSGEDKTVKAIRNLVREYADEVQRSELSLRSKSIYIDHVSNFVRWLHGDFQPGSGAILNRPKRTEDTQSE